MNHYFYLNRPFSINIIFVSSLNIISRSNQITNLPYFKMRQIQAHIAPNSPSNQYSHNSPSESHLNLPVSLQNACCQPFNASHQLPASKSAYMTASKVPKKLKEKLCDEKLSLSPQIAAGSTLMSKSECKLLLLGTEKSGKSSLMNLIFKPLFQQNKSHQVRTKEVVLSNISVFNIFNGAEVPNQPDQTSTRKVKLTIQEKTGSINQINCNEISRSIDGILIIYDHTNKKSLLQVQQWLERNNQSFNIPILVLGNRLPSKNQNGGPITEQVLRQFEMTTQLKVHVHDFKVNPQKLEEQVTQFINIIVSNQGQVRSGHHSKNASMYDPQTHFNNSKMNFSGHKSPLAVYNVNVLSETKGKNNNHTAKQKKHGISKFKNQVNHNQSTNFGQRHVVSIDAQAASLQQSDQNIYRSTSPSTRSGPPGSSFKAPQQQSKNNMARMAFKKYQKNFTVAYSPGKITPHDHFTPKSNNEIAAETLFNTKKMQHEREVNYEQAKTDPSCCIQTPRMYINLLNNPQAPSSEQKDGMSTQVYTRQGSFGINNLNEQSSHKMKVYNIQGSQMCNSSMTNDDTVIDTTNFNQEACTRNPYTLHRRFQSSASIFTLQGQTSSTSHKKNQQTNSISQSQTASNTQTSGISCGNLVFQKPGSLKVMNFNSTHQNQNQYTWQAKGNHMRDQTSNLLPLNSILSTDSLDECPTYDQEGVNRVPGNIINPLPENYNFSQLYQPKQQNMSHQPSAQSVQNVTCYKPIYRQCPVDDDQLTEDPSRSIPAEYTQAGPDEAEFDGNDSRFTMGNISSEHVVNYSNSGKKNEQFEQHNIQPVSKPVINFVDEEVINRQTNCRKNEQQSQKFASVTQIPSIMPQRFSLQQTAPQIHTVTVQNGKMIANIQTQNHPVILDYQAAAPLNTQQLALTQMATGPSAPQIFLIDQHSTPSTPQTQPQPPEETATDSATLISSLQDQLRESHQDREVLKELCMRQNVELDHLKKENQRVLKENQALRKQLNARNDSTGTNVVLNDKGLRDEGLQETDRFTKILKEQQIISQNLAIDGIDDGDEKTFKLSDIQNIIQTLQSKFEQEISNLKNYTDSNNQNILNMQNKISQLEVSTIQGGTTVDMSIKESHKNLISESLIMSKDLSSIPEQQQNQSAQTLQKPQAFLTYQNEPTEPKKVSFQIENSTGSSRTKPRSEKSPAINQGSNNVKYHMQTDSQQQANIQQRNIKENELTINKVPSNDSENKQNCLQKSPTTNQTSMLKRQQLMPNIPPSGNIKAGPNYAGGRIVMKLSCQKSKAIGLRTHGDTNGQTEEQSADQGRYNNNSREKRYQMDGARYTTDKTAAKRIDSPSNDSVSREHWENSKSQKDHAGEYEQEQHDDEEQTAKMTLIAEINSNSESGGKIESELSQCSGNEIIQIETSQSFKFGTGHINFIKAQPLSGCIRNQRKIYNTVQPFTEDDEVIMSSNSNSDRQPRRIVIEGDDTNNADDSESKSVIEFEPQSSKATNSNL